MSVKRVMAEFDSDEIAEWKAYDRLFPIDHAGRLDFMVAQLTAAVVAPHVTNAPKASDYYRDHLDEWRTLLGSAVMPEPRVKSHRKCWARRSTRSSAR